MNAERITSILLLFSCRNATRGLTVKREISYLAWMTACRWESHRPIRWRNPQAGLPSHSLHTSTVGKNNRNNIYIRKKGLYSNKTDPDYIFFAIRKTIVCKLNSTRGKICPITTDIMWTSQETITDEDDVIVSLCPQACSESILITSFLTQWKWT